MDKISNYLSAIEEIILRDGSKSRTNVCQTMIGLMEEFPNYADQIRESVNDICIRCQVDFWDEIKKGIEDINKD